MKGGLSLTVSLFEGYYITYISLSSDKATYWFYILLLAGKVDYGLWFWGGMGFGRHGVR
jgi:hypothetical protein